MSGIKDDVEFNDVLEENHSLKWFRSSLDKLRKETEEMGKMYYVSPKKKTVDWWWNTTVSKNNPEKAKELPQELKNYRQEWEKHIRNISWFSKTRIETAAKLIPLTAERQSDWSMLIEFTLWKKKYKILNPNLSNHSDDLYKRPVKLHYQSEWPIWITNKDVVILESMMWDNVDKWKNQKLKSYVKQKQKEWLHIPKVEEMRALLWELWNIAWLTKLSDQIAMLMYLTGMRWEYWLSMWYADKSRSKDDYRSMICCEDWMEDWYRSYWTAESPTIDASLCMMAVN